MPYLPTIRALPAAAADDGAVVRAVASLINAVYDAAEAGMWQPGTPRTDDAEIADAIDAGELLVAESGEALLGVVRTSAAQGTGQLGMLAVHPAARGVGLGRRLVDASEDLVVSAGARVMQVEVLTPLDGSNVSKVELDAWYTRLGYVHVRDEDLVDSYPQLGALLATPSVLRVYHKALGAGAAARRA